LLFIVLLSLLLIAGIYFQAPPKVLALVAIILATLTIIPKPARKWIWLTFAIIVIVLVVWVFLPEDNEGWRPYTFDKELAALEAKRAIPDDQNAATIYNKILEKYDQDDFEPNFMDCETFENLTTSGLWSSKDHPQLAEWFKGRKEIITILMQACERDLCRFPLRPDMIGLQDTTDRLGPMKDWAKLLIKAGNNNIGDGNIDEGIRKYLCVLQIAEHLYQQPSLSELLFAMPIEALGRRQALRLIVVGDLTEERLTVLDKSIGQNKHDWSLYWSKIIEYEKLFFKNRLAMFYEVNSKDKARFARDPGALMRQKFKSRGYELPPRKHWYGKFGKSRAILAWLYMPHSPHEAGKIFDESYEKHLAKPGDGFDWKKISLKTKLRLKFNYRYMAEIMAAMLGGPYHNIHDLYLRNIGQHRSFQLIIALRRYKNEHNHWPDSLDDVKSLASPELFIDPVNNDSFVYRLTDDDFTMYSKGKNNIDENGDRRTKKPDGTYTDDIPIYFSDAD
jgi:hypothetical protein